LAALIDEAGVVEREPVFEVRIGDFNVKIIGFLADERGRLKPCFVTIFVEIFLD
jgi:hypothetical protein